MTVERDHNPGDAGRQVQHPPPAGTTIGQGEGPTLAGYSDREKPLFEQDRHIRAWVGTSAALTEWQRLEDKLRASEQRFRITFEQAAVGLAHVALDGCWLLVNGKLCDIVGYTREELLERTFHSVMLPEDLPEAFAHAQRLITGELVTFVQEMRHVRKDGSLIWVSLTVTLVRDRAGMTLYFLAVMEDRTDHKQAELCFAKPYCQH